MSFKEKAKKHLFESIPHNFIDPITKLKPVNEIQLSSLLAFYHQCGRIAWNRVNLIFLNNTPSGKKAGEIIENSISFHCEYPLFANSSKEVNEWGGMSVDLLSFSDKTNSLILIENKIGSPFTGDKKAIEKSQLGRQVSYLENSDIANKYIIILSSSYFFNQGWYRNELVEALELETSPRKIKGYLMCWEEIFDAFK